MRVAGVRLPNGRAVWADAGDLPLSVRDGAKVRLAEGEVAGTVFVSPDQLVQPPDHIDGVLLEVYPLSATDPECTDLPGSDMPPLGSTIETGAGTGIVTAIDAVKRLVTITREDGSQAEAHFSPSPAGGCRGVLHTPNAHQGKPGDR